MQINLTRQDIDSALPKIRDGLNQYLWLQNEVRSDAHFHLNPDFRRRFNHFYRVRRGSEWRNVFYNLMGRAETLSFDAILEELQRSTGRLESSFSSKLYATFNPSAPVIDSRVLENLGCRLPYAGHPDRHRAVCTLYADLRQKMGLYLETEDGEYLINNFDTAYAAEKDKVSAAKKLDLVLWQHRQ